MNSRLVAEETWNPKYQKVGEQFFIDTIHNEMLLW